MHDGSQLSQVFLIFNCINHIGVYKICLTTGIFYLLEGFWETNFFAGWADSPPDSAPMEETSHLEYD